MAQIVKAASYFKIIFTEEWFTHSSGPQFSVQGLVRFDEQVTHMQPPPSSWCETFARSPVPLRSCAIHGFSLPQPLATTDLLSLIALPF